MEIQTRAFIVHSMDNVESFKIKVTEWTYPLIKAKIKMEHDTIVFILKDLKEKGLIKSIWIPKNKRLKKELDSLVTAKREMKLILKNLKNAFE